MTFETRKASPQLPRARPARSVTAVPVTDGREAWRDDECY